MGLLCPFKNNSIKLVKKLVKRRDLSITFYKTDSTTRSKYVSREYGCLGRSHKAYTVIYQTNINT